MLNHDPVAVVGVCIPKVAMHIPDETSTGLMVKAVDGALRDAGVERSEVDGMLGQWPGPGGSPQGGSSNWARLMGARLRWCIEESLDVAGVRAVLHAAAAIKAGLCETVVIVAGHVGGVRMPGAERRAITGTSPGGGPFMEFAWPYGGTTMARFATLARRHMHLFGTTQEQLAEVAATIRNHGHRNPEASMYGRGPYTVQDVLASRWIVEPLHLLDCCIVGDGAAAIVMTTGRRARALRNDPVYVMAGAMEASEGPHANPCLWERDGMMGRDGMIEAYGAAGVTPDDIDVLCAYDPTSFEIIRQVEALGFCKEGEGGPFVEGGRLALGGDLPTNPHGGVLSHSWFQGGQLNTTVVEAVRQLRGECEDRQVPDARIALCSNSGPAAFHWEGLLLGR